MSPPGGASHRSGKRYDIVSCFAALTRTVVADPAPLAPGPVRGRTCAPPVPLIDDDAYVPALARLCEEHGVGWCCR